MDESGIKKLAELSRLELSDTEVKNFASEISEILKYVDSLKEASGDDHGGIIESSANRNVMRADENPHTSGDHTEDLINEAPEHKDGYVKVKKVL